MADGKNDNELGPVWAAIAAGKGAEEVRRLVDAGARTSGVFDRFGRSPLMKAVRSSDTRAVRLLLEEARVPVDERSPNTGATALLLCNTATGEAMARLLLDAGADVDAKDLRGFTALAHCLNDGHSKAARLLLARGASPDVAVQHGYTPLMFAARNFWFQEDDETLGLLVATSRRSSEATRRATRASGASALDDLVHGGSQGDPDAGAYDDDDMGGDQDGPGANPQDLDVMERVLRRPAGRRVLGELLAAGAPAFPEHAAVAVEAAAGLRKALDRGRAAARDAGAARASLATLEQSLREAGKRA